MGRTEKADLFYFIGLSHRAVSLKSAYNRGTSFLLGSRRKTKRPDPQYLRVKELREQKQGCWPEMHQDWCFTATSSWLPLIRTDQNDPVTKTFVLYHSNWRRHMKARMTALKAVLPFLHLLKTSLLLHSSRNNWLKIPKTFHFQTHLLSRVLLLDDQRQ